MAVRSTCVIVICPRARGLPQPEGLGDRAAVADPARGSGLQRLPPLVLHALVEVAAALILVFLTLGTRVMEQPLMWTLPGSWQRQKRETGRELTLTASLAQVSHNDHS